jgi:hypothetical protein
MVDKRVAHRSAATLSIPPVDVANVTRMRRCRMLQERARTLIIVVGRQEPVRSVGRTLRDVARQSIPASQRPRAQLHSTVVETWVSCGLGRDYVTLCHAVLAVGSCEDDTHGGGIDE